MTRSSLHEARPTATCPYCGGRRIIRKGLRKNNLPVARLRPRTWTAATLPNGLCRRWRLAGTHRASWFARHEAVTSAAPVHPQQEGLKFLLDAQSQGTLTAAGRRLDLPPFTVLA
jgi:hypothetical protein